MLLSKALPSASRSAPSGRDNSLPARPRVLIAHHGCIPIYRKALFERLNKDSDIDFVVLHGDAPRGSDLILAKPPFAFPNIAVKNIEFRIGSQQFLWQPVVRRVLAGEFQAAVIGDEVKYLSNVVLAIVMRLQGKPVFFWGFGFHQYSVARKTRMGRIFGAMAGGLKKILYRIGAGYLAYSQGGARALRALKHPPPKIAVVGNTIDTAREAQFRAEVAGEPLGQICAALGVRQDSLKLLFFGRYVPAKQADLLVAYARHCAASGRKVDAILFGQGAEEQRLRRDAEGLANVVFHRHDDRQLARALRVSAAVVIPGVTGLAITHGFAHGVPVLTREGLPHGPEIEYLRDGANGLLLPQARDEFFAALDRFVDDPRLGQTLRDGAEQTARELDMDRMAANFRALVQSSLVR